MESKFSEAGNAERVLLTLNSISETIENLIDWNENVRSADDYYSSSGGMQLLAANCTLITAIGEGIVLTASCRIFLSLISRIFLG